MIPSITEVAMQMHKFEVYIRINFNLIRSRRPRDVEGQLPEKRLLSLLLNHFILWGSFLCKSTILRLPFQWSIILDSNEIVNSCSLWQKGRLQLLIRKVWQNAITLEQEISNHIRQTRLSFQPVPVLMFEKNAV